MLSLMSHPLSLYLFAFLRKGNLIRPKYTGTGIEVLMETESRLIHRFRKTAFEPFLNGPKIKGK